MRKHREHLQRLCAEGLGYRLVVEPKVARLFKAGLGRDASRPLRKKTTSSGRGRLFDPRAYALLCLTLAALTRCSGQLLLDELVAQVRSAVADAGLDLDLDTVADRRALAAALNVLIELGALVERDGALASLGGELLPCLRALDEVTLRWSPPVADDGPRLVGIEPGELLAFVLTVRSWLGSGDNLLSCAAAVELGVQRDEIAGHLDVGLDEATAVDWRDVDPDTAVRWRAAGFSRADVYVWSEQGRTLEQAEQAAAAAGDGRRLARWARITGPGQDAEALAEWAAFGAPVGVWGEVAHRGLRAPEVPAWLSAGFQPVEVLRYAHLKVPLQQAVRWRAAGFSGYVATGCLGVGMTLADACALRGLPTKQVQQLWAECGSVEAVLQAAAS